MLGRNMHKESGVTKRMEGDAVRRSAKGAIVAVLSLALSGCSAGHMPRPAVPTEERAMLDLAPDDAYLAVRLDLRAARATPHWPALTVALAENGLKEEAPHLDATDRVWLVVGGLVEAPAFEPAVSPAEELEEAFEQDAYVDEGYAGETYSEETYDEEPVDVTEPAWVPIARLFGGRLPRAVVIIEGGASTLCQRAVEGQALRQVRGYRLGVVNGVAVLVKDQRCVLTPEPVLDSLLSQRAGVLTDVIGMLGRAGEDGTSPILSYAMDFTAPAYAASTDLQLVDARAAVDTERERLEAVDAEGGGGVFGVAGPHGGSPHLATATLLARNLVLWSAQTTVLALEATRLTAHGFVGTTMQLSHSSAGYALHGRYALDEADRATMWRELSALYVGLARVAVATYDIPAPYKEALTAWLDSTRFDRERDGFSYRAEGSDEHVSAVLAAMQRLDTSDAVEGDAPPDAQATQIATQLQLMIAVSNAERVPPREAIVLLEPHVEALVTEAEQRLLGGGLGTLAAVYDSVGRHDEAVALLQRGVDRWREEIASPNGPQHDVEDPVFEMCDLAGLLCEQQLRWGFAEAAEQAALTPAGDGTCADANLRAFYCQQVAVGVRGDARETMEHMEARPAYGPLFFARSRAQLLIETEQFAEAYQAIRASCAGPFQDRACEDVREVLAEFVTRGSASLEEWDVRMAALRTAVPGDESRNAMDDRDASSLAVADCARRVRLAPRASETLSTCRTARDVADRLHGATHPMSIAARVHLAQALSAARQTEELTAVTSELEASRALVGPLHVLHRAPQVPAAPRRRR